MEFSNPMLHAYAQHVNYIRNMLQIYKTFFFSISRQIDATNRKSRKEMGAKWQRRNSPVQSGKRMWDEIKRAFLLPRKCIICLTCSAYLWEFSTKLAQTPKTKCMATNSNNSSFGQNLTLTVSLVISLCAVPMQFVVFSLSIFLAECEKREIL